MVLVADRHIAAFCHLQRIGQSFRYFIAEDLIHFIAGFEIEFIGGESHPVWHIHRGTGLDAQQQLVAPGMFPAQIVYVIGRHYRYFHILGQLKQDLVDQFLILDQLPEIFLLIRGQGGIRSRFSPVIHDFQIEIPASEDIQIIRQQLFCFIVTAVPCRHGDLALKTGTHTDDPLVILRQQFFINTGLVVESRGVRLGDQLAEIVITLLIFRQQDQVICPLFLSLHTFEQTRARRHIGFAPDDRLEVRLFHGVMKFQTAPHDPVIGQCHRFHAVFFRHAYNICLAGGILELCPGNGRCTIQQTVIRMYMQMYKIVSHSSRSFARHKIK